MAAPGEFFPQAFATSVLQLAQAQKQFQARLHEQRQQAAASNFLEKQRIDMMEKAQRIAEAEAQFGPRQPGGGQSSARSGINSPTSAFRAKSAESAMGVRDQLALEQGLANIKRSAKLQDQTDAGMAQKALADLEDRGYATFSPQDAGSIPELRRALQSKAQPTGAKEIVDAEGRSTGQFEKTFDVDFVETKMRDGSVLLTRIGGPTLDERRKLADIQRIESATKENIEDIALAKKRQEYSDITRQKRVLEMQQIREAIGPEGKEQKRLQALLGVSRAVEQFKSVLLTRAQDAESAALDAVLADDTPANKKALEEARAKRVAIDSGSALELLSKENPLAGRVYSRLDTVIGGVAMAGADGQQGKPETGGNALIRDLLDPDLRTLWDATPVDVAMQLRDQLPEGAHEVLPGTVTFPLRRKGGARSDAIFYADREGLIPKNESAYHMAQSLRKLTPEQQQAKLRAAGIRNQGTIRISPYADVIGWKPDDPTKRAPKVEPVTEATEAQEEAVLDDTTEIDALTTKIENGTATDADRSRARELLSQ